MSSTATATEAQLRQMLRQRTAALAIALDALDQIQWADSDGWTGREGTRWQCPACYRLQGEGHLPACPVGQVLTPERATEVAHAIVDLVQAATSWADGHVGARQRLDAAVDAYRTATHRAF